MLDATAWPRVRRLCRWLEQFHDCFHHPAQTRAFRRYVQGVWGDSGRKSMEAMLVRVTDPGHYQALPHFITHAVWDVAPVWQRLVQRVPVRRGVLIIDDTGWLKQGQHSVGVARQYCGAVGKVANCQVAVTTMLWARQRAWPLGMTLVPPQRLDARCGPPHPGRDSADGLLSGEVAPRADVAAARTCGGDRAHGGGGRRGVWRCQCVPRGPASVEIAICPGRLVAADGLPRHAARRGPGGHRPPPGIGAGEPFNVQLAAKFLF